jgi:hypothetical protein
MSGLDGGITPRTINPVIVIIVNTAAAITTINPITTRITPTTCFYLHHNLRGSPNLEANLSLNNPRRNASRFFLCMVCWLALACAFMSTTLFSPLITTSVIQCRPILSQYTQSDQRRIVLAVGAVKVNHRIISIR